MNGSTKIADTHRQRMAVVYIRQSDPKQVLQNRESGHNQRALQVRLRELGWPARQQDRTAHGRERHPDRGGCGQRLGGGVGPGGADDGAGDAAEEAG
jgi:hypothetical protein